MRRSGGAIQRARPTSGEAAAGGQGCFRSVGACQAARPPRAPLIPLDPAARALTPLLCSSPAPRSPPSQALTAYHQDVSSGSFPSAAFSPYRIPPTEATQLLRDLEAQGLSAAAEAVAEHAAAAAEQE